MEDRRAYQNEYYTANKEQIRRRKEVLHELEPEIGQNYRSYQSQYYYANREKLLAKKREKRLAKLRLLEGK